MAIHVLHMQEASCMNIQSVRAGEIATIQDQQWGGGGGGKGEGDVGDGFKRLAGEWHEKRFVAT